MFLLSISCVGGVYDIIALETRLFRCLHSDLGILQPSPALRDWLLGGFAIVAGGSHDALGQGYSKDRVSTQPTLL